MNLLRRAGRCIAHWRGTAAWLLLILMVLPPVKAAVESRMTTHMLIQFPCLMLVGGVLVERLPRRWQARLQRWNELGIAGLVLTALTLAVLMVPRVLDLALVDGRVEALKLLALVASGAALRLSWQRAGVIVQAFFLGNTLPMTAVVGTLYQDSALRVCNAYLLDDQQHLGLALVCVALITAALWLVHVARRRMGADAAGLQPQALASTPTPTPTPTVRPDPAAEAAVR